MKRGLFARVVQRQGWDVEFLDSKRQAEPETINFGTREDALQCAETRGPEWIEVGTVVPATDDVPQHHVWTTLRRATDGKYAASALVWGGGSKR